MENYAEIFRTHYTEENDDYAEKTPDYAEISNVLPRI